MSPPGPAIYANDNPVTITHGSFRWHCVPGVQAELFSNDAPAWGEPDNDSRFQLVKANPARRVFRTHHLGVAYYLKIYQPADFSGWLKRLAQGPPARKEFTNLRTAARRQAHVPVPVAWGEGRFLGRLAAALITPSLGEVVSLEDLVWSDNHVELRRLPAILAAAGAAIARLHCAGIIHHDLHAGNILIENTRGDDSINAYITDLQAVTIQPRSGHASADPAQRDRQRNLAVIIAALQHKLPEDYVSHLIGGYLRTIQPHQTFSDNQLRDYYLQLMDLARRHDARVMRARRRRCLRNSRYARRVQLADGWSAQVYLQHRHPNDQYRASALSFTAEDWSQALAKPDDLLSAGTLIKQGHHNVVREMDLHIGSDRVPVVIKHARVRSGLRGAWQALRRSRALRQWVWAHALIMRDIPTAWPLAALERRRWGLCFENIFITEKIPHAHNLKLALLHNQPLPATPRERYALGRRLGGILRQLNHYGLNHRDCKVSNIVIQQTRDENNNPLWRPYLIDLDGLNAFYGLRFLKRHQAVVRLAASSLELDHVTFRDWVAVFSGYLSSSPAQPVFGHSHSNNARVLWRSLSIQAQKRAGWTITQESRQDG